MATEKRTPCPPTPHQVSRDHTITFGNPWPSRLRNSVLVSLSANHKGSDLGHT